MQPKNCQIMPFLFITCPSNNADKNIRNTTKRKKEPIIFRLWIKTVLSFHGRTFEKALKATFFGIIFYCLLMPQVTFFPHLKRSSSAAEKIFFKDQKNEKPRKRISTHCIKSLGDDLQFFFSRTSLVTIFVGGEKNICRQSFFLFFVQMQMSWMSLKLNP